MFIGTITLGAVIAYVLLVVIVLGGLVWVVIAALDREWGLLAGGVATVAVCLVGWWWAMAFTLSGDYHAWNIKEGRVEKISSRLITQGDAKGPSQRFVFVIDGQPYGVDDTRAALAEEGDTVRLKCKKDYEWGVDRESHGWACRWAQRPGV